MVFKESVEILKLKLLEYICNFLLINVQYKYNHVVAILLCGLKTKKVLLNGLLLIYTTVKNYYFQVSIMAMRHLSLIYQKKI